METKIKT
jgi:myotubularin-related protein 6/7/8